MQVVKSKKFLSYLLGYEIKDILKICDEIDLYYYEFDIPKQDKSIRQIKSIRCKHDFRHLCPSKGDLKNIQKRIKTKILSKFNFPKNIQGGIKKRDNVTNAKIHLGKKYFLCTDIKKCFPSINQKLVYNMLIEYNISPDIAHILTRLTTYKHQVPQGAPTSSYIVNYVLKQMDEILLNYCEKFNIIYTRFIDDLVFSSQFDFKEKTNDILNIINNCGYNISNKKTFYKIGPTVITGVLTKNNVLDLTDELKTKMNEEEKHGDNSRIQGFKNYYKKVRKK